MLHTRNGDLVDGSGQRVYLRGINISNNEFRRKRGDPDKNAEDYLDAFFGEDVVVAMKEAGATHLDLHHLWLAWLHYEDGINETYFTDWLDHFIGWCEKPSLPYIINISGFAAPSMTLGPYNMPSWFYTTFGVPRPTTREEQARVVYGFWDSDIAKMESCRQNWIDTWAYIAERYGSNPNLLGYALVNEPLHHTLKYSSYDEAYAVHLGHEYSKLCERAIDAIRSAGGDQLVFVDKPYIGTDSNRPRYIQPVNKTDVVWETHHYLSTWHPTMPSMTENMDNWINKLLTFGKPVFVGEWGFDPASFKRGLPDWRTSFTEVMEAVDARAICGRSYFSHARFNGQYADLAQGGWNTAEDTEWIKELIFEYEGGGDVVELNKTITQQVQTAVTTDFKWISGATEPETPESYERASELDLDFGVFGKLWGFVISSTS